MGKSGIRKSLWWNFVKDAALLSVQFEGIGGKHSENKSQARTTRRIYLFIYFY